MSSVQFEKDSDNIVHMILDRKDGSANVMDAAFQADFFEFIQKLEAEDNWDGVIVRSKKKTFFAGGDLTALIQVQPSDAQQFFDEVEALKKAMRKLETMGKPVVACINGAALGGGWEIALSCHHRIALSKGVMLGLPEVTLGLLPGGGGVIRMTRLLGLQGAMPYLLEGKQFKPEKGKELGLIHDIVDTPEEMLEKAKAFIKANPESVQPYDVKGYKVPGGKPSSPALAQMLPIAPAMLRNQTKGVLPAPEAIMCTMVEGLQVDFDTATRIETRYFTTLTTGQISKNMIGTFWFQLNEIKAGRGRPDGFEQKPVKKVGILGAGMMGAGIAYSSAIKGIEVVLKDVSLDNAEKGKAYSETLLNKKVSRGRMSEEKRDGILSLIKPSANAEDLQGCDLIIEAVFEERGLKATVTKEAEAQIAGDAVFASNTSTLPITGLAEASVRPEQFIGLHFFSPVDKMPLVEIICGEKTNDETLARAYDYVQQIAKTPIVVNDSRGFFTSRVFGTFTQEGIAMVGEGVSAVSVENAAFLSGYPVGPLAVMDEVTLTLSAKVRKQTIVDMEAAGESYTAHPADAVADSMLEQDRAGKSTGGGFYDYPEGGKKKLWSGLDQYYKADSQIPLQDIKDRLLYIEAVETARCYEEKVLTSVRDANIGSIMGIGYPVWTGGVLQFINQTGLKTFVTRAQELAEKYGDRFTPPAYLVDMAEKGETFKDS
ncbi:3-hydroxyacyl-CoA dehydrogenase NAD-binding domain-containing protein [Pseudoteredinibacter isoporae]|uniref:3-hydroxyacyl-CoA dehydrogenase/enoyl-CoA hydratase/3-hydroxybutyryl-CoA epimerase n=1 Tax=Pseudoteredinibacter isoporae TaxID=570281 RepID=A0A7X0JPF0_9GAMM|nr:3-hydroxyacyl-CoA dehydrogenase NAD-binding domain-containing protein [Pseudoteredinibacter isoporae]MBB6519787.1 3-hydroxyacyl-CoA dehydrogenase/enoyl-CoA hydratase/3-hydroxybutyryl-CoA epimerase [Pseudoteredinibacter isoporae]